MAQEKGIKTTAGQTANEILVDYKQKIEEYKQAELPARQLFCAEYKSQTGGNVNITFAKESMTMQEIPEGATPDMQHVDYRSIEVGVKEYAIGVGVTRIMLEDSRFDEIRNALNEARRAADRNVLKKIMDEVKVGWYNADETPEAYGENTFDGTHDHIYTDNGVSAGKITLEKITKGIHMINEHGFRADTLLINSAQLKDIQDLAGFTAGGVPSPIRDAVVAAGSIGSILGLSIIVNEWIPAGKFVMVDRSVKPLAFVERRALTVESDKNAQFGIVGSYLSQRFGVKTRYRGAGVYVTV